MIIYEKSDLVEMNFKNEEEKQRSFFSSFSLDFKTVDISTENTSDFLHYNEDTQESFSSGFFLILINLLLIKISYS